MKAIKAIILALTSLGVLVLGSSCKSGKENKEEEIQYIVTNPLVKDTTILKEYVCQIRSINHIELRAMEKGYLEKIYVDEGQFVRKGQVMFQIMPALYQAELKKAEAEASFVELEYENTKKLAEKNVVSQNELALAKARLDKAKAELALAKIHLGFTEIRAPFDGIMDHFHVRLGSMVEEGDLLTMLSDNSKMWVYFNVPESEYLNYKSTKQEQAAKVRLIMANNREFTHTGTVETIEADFNNETGNIAFRATFPNPEGLLRHGETGNVVLSDAIDNALIIPQKATFEVLEKRYVFVVKADNTVEQREISIAAEMPDLYVVKAGLRANERILLEGIRKVKNNDKIAFTYADPEKVISQLNVYVE